jgi:5-methylthioadenosine/S-adenosylhomocysteine deaminase
MDILIKNGTVLLYKNNDIILENVDILIQNDTISRIEKDIISKDAYIIDAQNQCVMPGLINTHTHLPMSIFRGTFENCNLMDWLNNKIWPIEANLTENDVYKATMLSYIEQISTGTTCTNDHYFLSESIRKAAIDSKVRTCLTRVLMDSNGNLKERIEEFKELYNSRDTSNSLITYTVSPHSLYTCSDECLEAASKLALEYNLPVHLHFLESINEIDDIKKLHNLDASSVLKKYFSKTKNILAHGVKLTDSDIEILKTLDCGIAHNPVSNLMLGCKIADVSKYISSGINVALGTDGQGSGNNLDMFETMKFACLLPGGIHENEQRINCKDVIKMATINGAKLLGLDDKIGSIEIGKKADIILVDISKKLDNITSIPNNNILFNLVYNTSGRNVTTTIVNGDILMENRELKYIDIHEYI